MKDRKRLLKFFGYLGADWVFACYIAPIPALMAAFVVVYPFRLLFSDQIDQLPYEFRPKVMFGVYLIVFFLIWGFLVSWFQKNWTRSELRKLMQNMRKDSDR